MRQATQCHTARRDSILIRKLEFELSMKKLRDRWFIYLSTRFSQRSPYCLTKQSNPKKRNARRMTMQEQTSRDQRGREIPREDSDRFMTTEPGDYDAQDQRFMEQEQAQERHDHNENRTAMFEENETNDFRSRWQSI